MAEQSWVVYPHPMGMIKLEEIRAKADSMFPTLLKAAIQWKPTGAKLASAKPVYPAEIIDFKGTEADVLDLYFKNGWSSGVPIIPPTPERVAAMLKGTSHKPDEVVGYMAPRMGAVTVELVATHAVMAGCKPEHMPVLLSIAEILVRPEYRGPTTTTNPTAPFVIVNGPIRDKLGISYGTGAAGGFYRPNVCMGLVTNSLGDVIGGSKPPDVDKATLGWPGNIIAYVIGENEEQNPWGPLHVERGFKKDEDVVTIIHTEIPDNHDDHNSSKGIDLLRFMAFDMKRIGQNSRWFCDCDVIQVLSPEHAATIFNDGYKTKDQVRQYLWENAVNPIYAFEENGKGNARNIEAASKLLGKPATPETLVPMIKEPARIQIVVSGGAGKHSQYVSNFGGQTPRLVSVAVAKWK